MAIFVREKKLKNGDRSLYLDICYKGVRSYEFLNIYLKPETLKNRRFNDEMKEYAERIKAKRWNDILSNNYDLPVVVNSRINFFEFADSYISENIHYKKGYTAAIKMFKSFKGKGVLYTTEITEKYLNQFYDYLETQLHGETPSSYFKRLKRIFKAATKERLFLVNPAADIKCRPFESEEKDTLTFEEIKKLISAACPNGEVKAAFIFSCLTGLRWCDLKALRSNQINGDELTLTQKKTKVKATIALNQDAQNLIRNRLKGKDLVFNLPSHTGALKSLRKLLVNADISKKIRFHEARHSFGTNLIATGADIYTTSKLLGHTSLKHTTRYVRDNTKIKQEAVNKFPNMFK